MDLKRLVAFRAVFENGSVTQAAKILGLTQPAVSAQLSRLEDVVGFNLFERVAGRLKATAQGRQFYQEAVHALDTIERLQQSAYTIKEGQRGRITIASHPMASITLLPELIACFAATYPDVGVKLINRTSEEVRTLFDTLPVDIGIAELPINISAVELRRYSVPCVAITPKSHPLAAKAVLTPSDLSGVPFIMMSEGRIIGHQVKSTFADARAELQVVAESEYFSTICELVGYGRGVAVVDCWSAATFRHRVNVRRFEPKLDSQVGVFFRSDQRLSAPCCHLLELIDHKLRHPPIAERD